MSHGGRPSPPPRPWLVSSALTPTQTGICLPSLSLRQIPRGKGRWGLTPCGTRVQRGDWEPQQSSQTLRRRTQTVDVYAMLQVPQRRGRTQHAKPVRWLSGECASLVTHPDPWIHCSMKDPTPLCSLLALAHPFSLVFPQCLN